MNRSGGHPRRLDSDRPPRGGAHFAASPPPGSMVARPPLAVSLIAFAESEVRRIRFRCSHRVFSFWGVTSPAYPLVQARAPRRAPIPARISNRRREILPQPPSHISRGVEEPR
jgi:hypothetical protein